MYIFTIEYWTYNQFYSLKKRESVLAPVYQATLTACTQSALEEACSSPTDKSKRQSSRFVFIKVKICSSLIIELMTDIPCYITLCIVLLICQHIYCSLFLSTQLKLLLKEVFKYSSGNVLVEHWIWLQCHWYGKKLSIEKEKIAIGISSGTFSTLSLYQPSTYLVINNYLKGCQLENEGIKLFSVCNHTHPFPEFGGSCQSSSSTGWNCWLSKPIIFDGRFYCIPNHIYIKVILYCWIMMFGKIWIKQFTSVVKLLHPSCSHDW